MKIKMLCRHMDLTGSKLEKGLSYDLPESFAKELVNHGLAVLVSIPAPIIEPGFVNTTLKPKKPKTMRVFNKGGKIS